MRGALPLRAAPGGRLSLRLGRISAPSLPGACGLARRAAAIGRRAPARRAMSLARQRAVRCATPRLAAQRARGGAAAAAGDRAAVDARGTRALAGALALAGERHAGAARLRQADGDRLLGRAGAVFSLADVLDLLADEFAGDGAGGLTLSRFSARAFECAFFGHGVSFRRVSSAPLSRVRAPRAASVKGPYHRD